MMPEARIFELDVSPWEQERAKYRKIVEEGENGYLKTHDEYFQRFMHSREDFKQRNWEELFDILFRGHQNHKFLGHVFFGPAGREAILRLYRGEAVLPGEEGRRIYKEPAFCLHGPCGSMISDRKNDFSILHSNHKPLGFAVFKDSLYEKISSPQVSEIEWNETLEKIRHLLSVDEAEFRAELAFPLDEVERMRRGEDPEKLRMIHEEFLPQYLEAIDRVCSRIKTIFGVASRAFLDNGDPDIRNRIQYIKKQLHWLEGAIESIGIARSGRFYSDKDDFKKASPVVDTELNMDTEHGIRAVELTQDGCIELLSIDPEDIKYLALFGPERKKYKLLMSPKGEEKDS